jgi:hypothetical protein
MVEEEIEFEIFSSNLKRNLAPDKGESHSQFDEELAQVREEFSFEVALLRLFRESQEIEVVGVLDELLSEIGLWRRESRLKISKAFPCRR